jgi:hypothetical protein
MSLVAQFVEAQGCDAVIEIGEVWTAKALSGGARGIDKMSERGEALMVMVATREGLCRTYVTPFRRGRFGGIKLEDTEELDKQHLSYLEPVINVWRKQTRFRAQDGAFTNTWEPDLLDLCPCGGPDRYGVCCRTEITKMREKAIGTAQQRELAEEIANEASTEKEARAKLARYVIWIRQHTASAMEAGAAGQKFYQMMVQVDALALQSHIVSMIGILKSAGKSALIVPQLHRLRDLVGVPKLAMRITAVTAEWLFDSESPEEAVLELDGLGDPFALEDSLALSLIARNFDLTEESKGKILERAIAKSCCDEEKHLAMLSFASYLSKSNKPGRAEPILRTILRETDQGGTFGDRSAALILLWSITADEEDYKTAMVEIQKSGSERHLYANASHLINGGKYSDAERLLEKAVQNGDAVAQLLAFDAKLLGGNAPSARDAFAEIDRNSLSPSLKFPYAAAAANLVLVGRLMEFREEAISLLSSLPAAGSPQDNEVKHFLILLDEAVGPT